MGNVLGYARITTTIQRSYQQLHQLKSAGCTELFVDYVSGPGDPRPELERVLRTLILGDTLVVTRLDRPGRSLQHILTLVDCLIEKGVELRILSGALDSQSSDEKALFPAFAALSEMVKDLALERKMTQPIIEKAGGRPALLTDEQVSLARQLYAQSSLTVAEIGSRLGVSRTTVYRALEPTDAESLPAARRRPQKCAEECRSPMVKLSCVGC